MTDYRVLEDRIRLEPVAKKQTGAIVTQGGEEFYAKVVAVGPWVEAVEPGDLIVYAKDGVEHYQVGGEDIYIIREYDALALVKL